ncbi:M20 family metallopeptidase [Arthrobacter psychrochitiniphilus]|uniref:M20 family metallopeptidase n=1 Tax=Arthrobacter psychrochitiniphilus TaxID=291045 RepID=UPI0011B59B1E|nr:M20 family metallopeptidase [Arthrobacter psychrochitiniphilus]NYG16661.1 metal-dependent amidase/aminoacylase/carboxypeptidase family protein [Arthrobacter psychrochitiniphilus]
MYQRNAQSLDRVFDTSSAASSLLGSTDMGNLSHLVPSIHPLITVDSASAVIHQPEFAAYCVSASTDQAVIDGGKAMAWTIVHSCCTK